MLKQLVVAAAVAAVASIPLHAEIVEQVLVKVNGEIITKTEFETRQVAALRIAPSWRRPARQVSNFNEPLRRSRPISF